VRHCHPDSHTSAASNFLTKASCVLTVDLLHATSVSVERAFGPWQTNVWTVEFELRTCLKE
jgi:hypothetical protein